MRFGYQSNQFNTADRNLKEVRILILQQQWSFLTMDNAVAGIQIVLSHTLDKALSTA